MGEGGEGKGRGTERKGMEEGREEKVERIRYTAGEWASGSEMEINQFASDSYRRMESYRNSPIPCSAST